MLTFSVYFMLSDVLYLDVTDRDMRQENFCRIEGKLRDTFGALPRNYLLTYNSYN